METRVCRTCHVEKLLYVDFYRHKSSLFGRERECIECNKKRSIKWQRENKKVRSKRKEKAMRLVRTEIEKGRMKNPKELCCKDCGEQAMEYHHEDYDDALSVVPLCFLCHKKRHRNPSDRLKASLLKYSV